MHPSLSAAFFFHRHPLTQNDALLCDVQEQQQQLGQQLIQQLEQLHSAVQAGVAVDPVTMAAAATAAAAATGSGSATGADTAAAVGHPAVAVSFLRDLAAFGKGVAAGRQPWTGPL
jgi:hypothetical protein